MQTVTTSVSTSPSLFSKSTELMPQAKWLGAAMSPIGTKRTCGARDRMSAFGVKQT